MEEILNWTHLSTTAGVSAAVVALTQIIKNYMPKADPKWIALVLSLVVTFTYQLTQGDYQPSAFVLSALNAVLSAGTAIGAFEAAKSATRAK